MTFQELDNQAPIWTYQADRQLTDTDKKFIQKELAIFFEEWESHGETLHGAAIILDDFNVVIGVQPPQGKMCGGSVDSLFRFMKSMGSNIQVDFFNRLKVVTETETGNLEIVPFFQLENHANRNMFNLAINRKEALNTEFKIPVNAYLTSIH